MDALRIRGARVGILDLAGPTDPDAHVAWAKCDVASSHSVADASAVLAERLGPADILVSNAGVSLSQTIVEHGEEDWRRVLAVNLDGARHGVTANVVAPGLTDTGMTSKIYGGTDGAREAVAFLSSRAGRHMTGSPGIEVLAEPPSPWRPPVASAVDQRRRTM